MKRNMFLKYINKYGSVSFNPRVLKQIRIVELLICRILMNTVHEKNCTQVSITGPAPQLFWIHSYLKTYALL